MRATLLAVLLCGSCAGAEPIRPPLPAPIGADDCERAQSRLEALGCAEFLPATGDSFAVRCNYAASDGRDWRPDCIARAESCAEVPQC